MSSMEDGSGIAGEAADTGAAGVVPRPVFEGRVIPPANRLENGEEAETRRMEMFVVEAPIRWNGSALRKTVAPVISSSVLEVRTGVRCATPRNRSAAAWTSAKVMAGSVVLVIGCVAVIAWRPPCVIRRRG